MNFSDALKRAMKGMSISELSRQSGVPVSTISRHLHGEHLPTLAVLEAYEAALPPIKRIRHLVGAKRAARVRS